MGTAYIESIRQRVSVRTYVPEPLSAELLEQAQGIVASPVAGPLGLPCRFELVDARHSKEVLGVKLGTYGFVSGAPLFLVGCVRQAPRAELEFGYVLEEMILRLTALGLGTCWMGGTFSQTAFAKVLKLGPQELLPAVSPLGLPAAKATLRERLGKKIFASRSRKPWAELFFKAGSLHTLTAAEAGSVGPLLEAVQAAPSAVNRQPWRVVLEGDCCHFFLERSIPVQRPRADMQLLDLGIALAHFRLAAQELGMTTTVLTKTPEAPAGKKWESVVTVKVG
jgi:nitroreductase